MLKLGVRQAEDIAKGVGQARDVHTPVRGPRPMAAQTGAPPHPHRAGPALVPRPVRGSAGRAKSSRSEGGQFCGAFAPARERWRGPRTPPQGASPWAEERSSKASELTEESEEMLAAPFPHGCFEMEEKAFIAIGIKLTCLFLLFLASEGRSVRLSRTGAGAALSPSRPASATLCHLSWSESLWRISV